VGETRGVSDYMTIVSISLPEKLLSRIDDILESEGYTSRSEFIRSLLRSYIEEKTRHAKPLANLIIVQTNHDEALKVDQRVVETIHKYQGIVKAFYHQILQDSLCLNIAVVDEVPGIPELLRNLRRLRGVIQVWYIQIPKPYERSRPEE